MNIEEERKAFLIHFPPACCLNFSDGKWSTSNASIYQENVLVIACVRWESWLAAKAHVEEMAKPACILEVSDDVYRLRLSWRPDDFLNFIKEENARAWAKENGYRVLP